MCGRVKSQLVMGDGGNGNAGDDSDGKPFCGSLQAHKECSAVRGSDCGVALVLESLGARFFVRQIFFLGSRFGLHRRGSPANRHRAARGRVAGWRWMPKGFLPAEVGRTNRGRERKLAAEEEAVRR